MGHFRPHRSHTGNALFLGTSQGVSLACDAGFPQHAGSMIRILEHQTRVEETKTGRKVVLIVTGIDPDEPGNPEPKTIELAMVPMQAHRVSDDVLRAVAKAVPRTGTE